MTDATALCVDCIADEVEHPRAVYARDRCNPHYQRARKSGTIEKVYRDRRTGEAEVCEADCERPAAVKGLCRSHYARKRRNAPNWADRLPEDSYGSACTASWAGADGQEATCGLPIHGKGLCGSHAWQKRNGKPFTAIRQRKSPGGKCESGVCPKRAVHDGLCGTHYDRRRKGVENWDAPIREKRNDGEGWYSDGYFMIHRDGRTRGEHLWIAEELLGHSLRDGENVHHRNGNRSDNRTDGPFVMTPHGKLLSGNLEVWSTKQPAGQEVGPKLDWAFEMIGDYLDVMDPARLRHLLALAAMVTPDMISVERERIATALDNQEVAA